MQAKRYMHMTVRVGIDQLKKLDNSNKKNNVYTAYNY